MSIVTETEEATANVECEDRFKFDIFSDLHFPCAYCIHREKKVSEACDGCRYYFD